MAKQICMGYLNAKRRPFSPNISLRNWGKKCSGAQETGKIGVGDFLLRVEYDHCVGETSVINDVLTV